MEWISVKDRLPEHNDYTINNVLVTVKRPWGEKYVDQAYFTLCHDGGGKNFMWIDVLGDRYERNGGVITHWALLPEPAED